jgi:hypothetical protein
VPSPSWCRTSKYRSNPQNHPARRFCGSGDCVGSRLPRPDSDKLIVIPAAVAARYLAERRSGREPHKAENRPPPEATTRNHKNPQEPVTVVNSLGMGA